MTRDEVDESAVESRCPVDHSSLVESSRTAEIRPLDAIPGPRPMPLLGWRGNTLRFLRDPIAYLRQLRQQHGTIARFVAGSNPSIVFRPTTRDRSTIFVLGPDGARDVLTQPDVFTGGEFRAPKGLEWINHSMVSAEGGRRKQRRGTMSPAFARDHLKSYVSEVEKQTRIRLDRWRRQQRVDLAGEMFDFASGIARTCFFGQDPSGGGIDLAAMVRMFAEGLVSPLAGVPVNLPGTPYHRLRHYGEIVYRELLAEIDRKRAGGNTGDDILAMMIASQAEQGLKLTNDELMGDAVALFLAGHDVPANAITYALILLSQHPQIASRLWHELDREVDGDMPAYSQVWRLPYLDRVVKESLRILGPTLMILRSAAQDGIVAGYEVPAGSEVLTVPYIIHTDPEVWQSPLRFDPDRWLDTKPSAFEYLPFSYGARKCLGAPFAELLMKIVLCVLVKNVRLTPVDGIKIDFFSTFVISPKGKVPVHVSAQDGNFEASRVRLGGQITTMVELTG
ncbi:MAG: cytochrome P450 [Thermoanaerobaculia bacterium]|nr:cytochrome P450 [Thermoanaerobaculia bacterium]